MNWELKCPRKISNGDLGLNKLIELTQIAGKLKRLNKKKLRKFFVSVPEEADNPLCR